MEKYQLRISVSTSVTPNNSAESSWGDEIKANSIREAVDVATEKLKNRIFMGSKRCSIELTLLED